MNNFTCNISHRPSAATRAVAALALAGVLSVPAVPVRADYQYICLRQEGDFRAALILERLSRERADRLDAIPSAAAPVWRREFFGRGLHPGRRRCVAQGEGWRAGDRLRARIRLRERTGAMREIFCEAAADRHAGFFLIPDHNARQLEFRAGEFRGRPTCRLASAEVMHSECNRELDGMRLRGCAHWAPAPRPGALHDIVVRRRGLGMLGGALDLGADPDELRDGDTPLTAAVKRGRADYARGLAARGANLNAPDGNGRPPLLLAVQNGRTALAKFLLARGANPDLADPDGVFPLHAAAAAGALPLMELLLKYGADPDRRADNGATALQAAADNNREAAVRYLQAATAPGATAR